MKKHSAIPFFRLIRGLAYIRGLSVNELAIATGIIRSRIQRILCGATLARRNEAEQLLNACGLDPTLLIREFKCVDLDSTVVSLSASKRHHSETPRSMASALGWNHPLALLLFPEQSPEVPSSCDECKLSVDKISLTFNVGDEKELLRLASRGNLIFRKEYAYSYDLDGLFLQHGSRKSSKSSSRLEFNPGNFLKLEPTDDPRRLLTSILALVERSTVRVTRLDVAVDIPISIRSVQALGNNKLKYWTVYGGSKGAESVYLGDKKSSRRFRLYDKRQEMIDKGLSTKLYPPKTRFEAVLKRPNMSLKNLLRLVNPFADLRLFFLAGEGLPLKSRLLVGYAAIVGLPALKHEMPKHEFESLVREVEIAKESPEFSHPAKIFDQLWPKEAKKVLRLLGMSKKGE